MPSSNTAHSRLGTLAETARFFQVSPRTIENWHERGYIVGYRTTSREIRFDLDEIELKLTTMPRSKMRDGRRRGRRGRVVVLPVVVEAVDVEAQS